MQNLTWFPFSVVALVCFGFSMAFYKLPSTKNQNRYAVSFWQLFISFLISLIVFYKFIPLTNINTVIYGSLWGLAFLCLSLLQMKELKEVDTNMLYPITSSLSLVGSVLFGVIFFKDGISVLQIIGIILVLVVVYLFSYKGKKMQYSNQIIVIGLGILFLSVFSKIIQKFAVNSVNINSLQIFQYFSAALFSIILYFMMHRKEFNKHIFSNSILSGLMIAVPSFIGGAMYLIALKRGPFSLVTSIHSLYIVVVAIVAYFIFKEKLTWYKFILIIIAILAMILIKIG
jgi:drug/metabolite transporter (DMT)-like permease